MRSESSGRFSARRRGLGTAGVAALVAAIALGAGALYCALRGDALLAGAIEEIVAQVTDTPASSTAWTWISARGASRWPSCASGIPRASSARRRCVSAP